MIPELMGVLNVTPDSFSDGGRYREVGAAVDRGVQLFDEGADLVDVGGESTRPGADPVGVEEECDRVIPVVAQLAARCPGKTISIDTSKPAVAQRAVDAGATVINDVTGIADEAMAQIAARSGAAIVAMHMRGAPKTMQRDTRYSDLLGEIEAFLRERIAIARASGVPDDRIWIDPGIGFGKAPADNPAIIAAIPRLAALGHRLVIGTSRKTFIGHLTGRADPGDRLAGSIGAALAAAEGGAHIVRVHDVAATRDALVVWAACRSGSPSAAEGSSPASI